MIYRSVKGRVFIIEKRNRFHLEARNVHIPYFKQINACKYWIVYMQHSAVFSFFLKKITVRTDINRRVCYYLLPYGVNGRVGYLSEYLLEIAEQWLVLIRKHGKGYIYTHRGRRLGAVGRHWKYGCLYVLVCVAESLIQLVSYGLRVFLDLFVWNGKILEIYEVLIQPFAIGLFKGETLLKLLIGDYTAGLCIHEKHFSGLKTGFFNDLCRVEIKNADLGGKDQIIVVRNIVS